MSYTRLTVRHPNSDYIAINETKQLQDSEQAKKVLNRLAEFEDKIEKGTIIELPCKVGDTVYLVHRDKHIIECWTVEKFSVEEAGIWLHIRNEKLLSAIIHSKSKGVCFTREEAEKRLKELQNG